MPHLQRSCSLFRSVLLAGIALLQANLASAGPTCISTKGGNFCVRTVAFGLGGENAFVPGEITALDSSKQEAEWNGKMMPLVDLATIERGDCQSQSQEPVNPDPWDHGPHREHNPVCVGDRVIGKLEKGLVVGKFGDGQLLLAGEKLPAHRVQAYRFLAAQAPPVSKRGLLERMQRVSRLPDSRRKIRSSPGVEVIAPQPPEPQYQKSCDRANPVFDSWRSPARKHFESLLIRGTSAPLEDFLQLWFPEKSENLDSPYFACEKMPGGPFRSPGENAEFTDPNCRPDILYTWGPRVKLDAIRKNLPNGAQWSGVLNPGGIRSKGSVFFSISAASTFCYGPVLMRFKLKQNTLIRNRNFGAEMGELAVRAENKYHDFVVLDASVVESFSFGTPEIYDEVVRDVRRFRANKRVSIYKNPNDPPTSFGLDRLWEQADDGYVNDEIGLKERLLELIREILAGESGVHFASGVCPNRARHFATRNPNYLNPYPLID